MTELNAEDVRRAIVEHTRGLAESAAAAGPDAAVPTTPEWDHHRPGRARGPTQHRVAQIIERRVTDPTQLPTDMAVLPTDAYEWPAWLAESSRRVASACSDDALDAPVFNPAGDGRPGTAAVREATNITVDGDSDLAQHWLDDTAHVSG